MPEKSTTRHQDNARAIRAEYRSRQAMRRLLRLLFLTLFLALVCLLALSYVPSVARWEALLNRAFALWANRLLVGNVVAEWTFVLVLHGIGQAVLWSVLAVCIGRAILQRRDGFRLLGYVLWASACSVVAYQVADQVGDVVELDTPIDALQDIRPLSEFRGKEFGVEEANDFPDDLTVAFSCGLLLLMLRIPRATLPGLIMPLLMWIGMILDGRAWVIHHTLSASIGICTATFAYAFMGKTRRPVEHWTERVANRLMIRPPKWLGSALRRHDTHARIRIKRARDRKTEMMWNRLVDRELAPFVKPMTEAHLLPTPPDHNPSARHLAKASRYVRFLKLQGYPTIVIKAAWKRFGLFRRGRRLTRYESSVRKHLTLDQLGLSVPHIYWQSSGILGPTFDRFCMVAEEYVSSRPTDITRPDDVTQIAEALALIHSNRSPVWGELGLEQASARTYATGRLRQQIHRALKPPILPRGSSWAEELEELCWHQITNHFQDYLDLKPDPFALVHGDVGTQNFRFQNNQLVIVDLLTTGFDLPGPETLQAAVRFGRHTPDQFARFWQTYFSKAGSHAWEDFLSCAGVTCSMFFLREFGHGRTRVGPLHPQVAPEIADIVERLVHLPDSLFGKHPQETDLERLLDVLQLQFANRTHTPVRPV